ncbi:hypothetical protein ACH4OY_19635 [Micromonospora rubida]|uniref:Uncharacterized protein n=1 Tax=Micromonospora rubida TaxID=2697657 RepID=A0ABW7SPP7_9ACTN
MKFGIYPGGRAGTVCSYPPDPTAISVLVDDLAGGRPFAVREYVHFFGDDTPPDVVASLGADHADGVTGRRVRDRFTAPADEQAGRPGEQAGRPARTG